MSDFEKSMVEMTKRANDFVHEKRAEGITVIPAGEFFEAIGIIDFFFGNNVKIDISNFKGDEEEIKQAIEWSTQFMREDKE